MRLYRLYMVAALKDILHTPARLYREFFTGRAPYYPEDDDN